MTFYDSLRTIHSELFDTMGFEPSLYNKINIHIVATYGDKTMAIKRFKENYSLLSDNCKMRMPLENDDTPNDYSIDDLLPIAKELNCAVTYDLHHYKFWRGNLSAKEALEEAMKTWGTIKPVVHWSESPEDLTKKRSTHSDYVYNLELFGHEYNVDIMIESKMKELALLRYRSIIKNETKDSECISEYTKI